MPSNYPDYNKNKRRYLELLQKRLEDYLSESDNLPMLDDLSKYKHSEIWKYSCQLGQQVEWELREQYLDLMEDFLKDRISMPEFFAELRTKHYSIMTIVGQLEKHRILLTLDKKAPKFSQLMEPINDELEGDLTYTGEEFVNFIQENYIKIKKYLNEE